MTRSRARWDQMYRELEAYTRVNGHCLVQTNDPDNPKLGRWVAAQRYKRGTGELETWQIDKLNGMGFVWSACDAKWEQMFKELAAFQKEYGHCEVPEKFDENASLGWWVQNQRRLKKNGKLAEARLSRLESIGFSWSTPKGRRENGETLESRGAGSRLYSLGNGRYVQYDGVGRMPEELAAYQAEHHGELPPYVPLPRQPVEFRIGIAVAHGRRVRWKGHGKLDRAVLDYVRREGSLPEHHAAAAG